MPDLRVTMTLRAYDQVCPLLLGDVPTPGIELSIDHRAPMTLQMPEGLDIAEVSFNRYVLGRARGDRNLIGIPAFILQGFRHRNFFVRADSPLQRLSELKGMRLGSNSWPDSGTMWARAAMRDAGVEVDDVRWVIGTLDEATPTKPPSPNDASPPAGARYLGPGETLLDELRAGRIDAVTTAFAPDEVFRQGGWLRRLVQNYPEVEADYRRRTGIYPAFHIMAARRDFAEQQPEALLAVYRALQDSYRQWIVKLRKFAEASPWAMSEHETMLREFDGHAQPFGVASPSLRRMLSAICAEQYAQKMVDAPAAADELFAEFETIRNRYG